MGEQNLKPKAVKEATLTRYLLGYLSKKKMAELEKMYFADDDLYEALCVAEHELIDRYVYGELSRAERKRFESHFLAADSRRQKTRISAGIETTIFKIRSPVNDRISAEIRVVDENSFYSTDDRSGLFYPRRRVGRHSLLGVHLSI